VVSREFCDCTRTEQCAKCLVFKKFMKRDGGDIGTNVGQRNGVFKETVLSLGLKS